MPCSRKSSSNVAAEPTQSGYPAKEAGWKNLQLTKSQAPLGQIVSFRSEYSDPYLKEAPWFFKGNLSRNLNCHSQHELLLN